MTMGRHERGLALVVVLWTIAALSLIAGAMLATAMTSAKIERNSWTQLTVRTAADSAIQGAILSLFDTANPPPLDGRERQALTDGVAVTLTIQDQRGLIDLNLAGPKQLGRLLQLSGADGATANGIAARIVDWRSPAGTESLDENDGGTGYRPRHAPFQSLDELQLVAGITPEIYARLARALTVYSHRPDFDMRAAPSEVLRTIPGMDQAAVNRTIATRSTLLVRPGVAFAIIAKARKNEIRFTRNAVVQLTGDPARPYRILDWR